MAINNETLAAARKYTDNSIAGGGAIRGKNCTIESVTEVTGGQNIVSLKSLPDQFPV